VKAGLIEDRRPTLSIHLAGSRGWRTTDARPILEAVHHAYALRADGGLGEDEGEAGSRAYIALAATFLLVVYQLGDSVRAAYARLHLRAPALHGQLDGSFTDQPHFTMEMALRRVGSSARKQSGLVNFHGFNPWRACL